MVSQWCATNHIMLNIQKCSVITFSRKHDPIKFCYCLNGMPVKRVTSVRDLGVVLDEGLKFNSHIDNICKTATRMLGFITRSCRDLRDAKARKALFSALVRSHLEYASVIWSPFTAQDKGRLEAIQKKFIRTLKYARGSPEDLKMDTLEERRLWHDLSFLCKLLQGDLDCSELLSQVPLHVPSMRLRSSPTFNLPLIRSEYLLQRNPVWRACNNWNRLVPVDWDCFHDSMKSKLRTINLI